MPAAFARDASSLPASLACSIGLSERRSASVHWTDAIVRPASSSMSWANTPRLERNTEIRGRSAEPCTFARTRRRRRRRFVGGERTVMLVCSACGSEPRRGVYTVGSCPLAYLPGDVLALVTDALALVGLRRALLADDRRDLADNLLVVALDDDARRDRHLELDPLGRLDRHGVGVAERPLEIAPLQQRAITDALDLERLGEAGRHAFDHVRDQRAREPVQGPVLGAVGRAGDEQVAVLLDDLDRAVLALLEVAPGPVHAHDLRLHRDGDGRGDGDGLSTDAGHESDYQTSATSSPPTPAARASWPVMTPCEVDRMVVPIPPRTLGIDFEST